MHTKIYRRATIVSQSQCSALGMGSTRIASIVTATIVVVRKIQGNTSETRAATVDNRQASTRTLKRPNPSWDSNHLPSWYTANWKHTWRHHFRDTSYFGPPNRQCNNPKRHHSWWDNNRLPNAHTADARHKPQRDGRNLRGIKHRARSMESHEFDIRLNQDTGSITNDLQSKKTPSDCQQKRQSK